jgi:hypothetical protein
MVATKEEGAMTESQLLPVRFHEDTVWAARPNGEVLVAVRGIVESFGLGWSSQHKRLMRHHLLARSVVMMTTETPVGAREMVCLPLDLLPGWLFGVDTKRVREEIRPKLEQYQAECFKVLWQHFNRPTMQLVPPAPAPMGLEQVCQRIDKLHALIEAGQDAEERLLAKIVQGLYVTGRQPPRPRR